MKCKNLLLAASAMMLASGNSFAQQAGDNIISAGWLHIMPLDSSKPMTTSVTQDGHMSELSDLIPPTFTSYSTGATVSSSDTLGLVFTHFFTDNIAIEGVAGLPARMKVYGKGKITAGFNGVDLGDPAINPLVTSARQWSPALLLQYYFGRADSEFRPFLGIGVCYTTFSNIHLNSAFENTMNSSFGSTLATESGHGDSSETNLEAKASSSWAPVFNAGFAYNISKHWVASGSISYVPIKTTANILIRASDGAVLSSSDAKIALNPLVTFVSLGYKF